MIKPSLFYKKIERLKLRIIKVYGRPTLFVFYFRHLKLKLTVKDLFD